VTDIFDDIFDDAEAFGSVDTDTGKSLSNLVRSLRSVEKEITDTEEHLKALKQQKHKLSTEQIPALMDEMGVERIDVDGVTVARKLIVHASIPAERKDEAFMFQAGMRLQLEQGFVARPNPRAFSAAGVVQRINHCDWI